MYLDKPFPVSISCFQALIGIGLTSKAQNVDCTHHLLTVDAIDPIFCDRGKA